MRYYRYKCGKACMHVHIYTCILYMCSHTYYIHVQTATNYIILQCCAIQPPEGFIPSTLYIPCRQSMSTPEYSGRLRVSR